MKKGFMNKVLPYDYLAPAVACNNYVDARSRQRRLLAFGNEGAVGSIYGKRAYCGNESSAIETEGCLAGDRITVEKLGIPSKWTVKHAKFSNLTKFFLLKPIIFGQDKRYVDYYL